MAVTPNYGWTIPVATDYVKDGWDAIATLGTEIDATVAGLGSGLTLITAATLTAQPTLNVNNCFSNDYTNYKIIIDLLPAGSVNFFMRMRASGTDSTTGYYRRQFYASGYYAGSNEDRFYISDGASATRCYATMEINSPFLTKSTMENHSVISETIGQYYANYHSAATSYDGFTIFTGSSNATGTVTVYGYDKV